MSSFHVTIQEICHHFTSIRIIILLGPDLFSNYQGHGHIVTYVNELLLFMNKVLHLYFEKEWSREQEEGSEVIGSSQSQEGMVGHCGLFLM